MVKFSHFSFMTSYTKNVFIFEISEIIPFIWCIIWLCQTTGKRFRKSAQALTPHYDVIECLKGVSDVINRKIVKKWSNMESLKKFYGAVFTAHKKTRFAARQKKTAPWQKWYTHMRLKKRFKIFFFRISFHSIQEKRFSYQILQEIYFTIV